MGKKGLLRSRDFSSLSIKDLLEAREAYHVHLAHLDSVVATAIGRYRIRREDPDAENPYHPEEEDIHAVYEAKMLDQRAAELLAGVNARVRGQHVTDTVQGGAEAADANAPAFISSSWLRDMVLEQETPPARRAPAPRTRTARREHPATRGGSRGGAARKVARRPARR